METKNSLDVIKEMTCKIKEATTCLVKEEQIEKISKIVQISAQDLNSEDEKEVSAEELLQQLKDKYSSLSFKLVTSEPIYISPEYFPEYEFEVSGVIADLNKLNNDYGQNLFE